MSDEKFWCEVTHDVPDKGPVLLRGQWDAEGMFRRWEQGDLVICHDERGRLELNKLIEVYLDKSKSDQNVCSAEQR